MWSPRLMRSDHTSRYQGMSAIGTKRTSLFAPHMSAFRGIADATIVVIACRCNVASHSRVRASSTTRGTGEGQSVARCRSGQSTSPRSMTFLAWQSQWCMTTVGSDTALWGCPLLALSRHELLHRTCPLSGVERTCFRIAKYPLPISGFESLRCSSKVQ